MARHQSTVVLYVTVSRPGEVSMHLLDGYRSHRRARWRKPRASTSPWMGSHHAADRACQLGALHGAAQPVAATGQHGNAGIIRAAQPLVPHATAGSIGVSSVYADESQARRSMQGMLLLLP